MSCKQEEELASIDGDNSEDSEGEDAEVHGRPEDKENVTPNDGTAKQASSLDPKKMGRKRKRQTSRREQHTGPTRRQRIRQYYNGASHSSASAVQLFAMAMQVRFAWYISADRQSLYEINIIATSRMG